MVRLQTKDGRVKDGKKYIRKETNGERTDWETKNEMEDVCNDTKVVNEKNWKELVLKRKAWNDVVEKSKTHNRL